MAIKDFSFGVIPVYKDPNTDQFFFLLIHNAGDKGYWGFPKGHKENNESNIEAARRELLEETGIEEITINEEPAFPSHYFFKMNGVDYDKVATFYIGQVKDKPTLELQLSEVDEAEWLEFDSAHELLTFDILKKILEKANQWLIDNTISL